MTEQGKPVRTLTSTQSHELQLFGALSGTMTFAGDIVSPMNDLWDELEECMNRGWDDE